MKAKLNYFSLLLFSNVNRLSINDMLGVEPTHRFSGGIMLVLTLFILIGGNVKAATNQVHSTNGTAITAALNTANLCAIKSVDVSNRSENLIISKTIALQPDYGAASSAFSCINETGTAGLTINAINTYAGFINFSEREIL